MLIQESGERRILAVGAVFGSYDCHLMPGWEGGTVGYHADDGKIFEPSCDELGREVEGNSQVLLLWLLYTDFICIINLSVI